MRIKKRYLIIIVIFVLCFAIVFQRPRTILNEQNDMISENIENDLSSSSVVYEWYRTWGE